MYGADRRVELVKERVRAERCRRQRRSVYGLMALCVLLGAAIVETAGLASGPGQSAAQGAFGAMLLRENAGGYVLLGVISFAAAVVLTVVCIRLQDRKTRGKTGADRPAPRKQEEKTV